MRCGTCRFFCHGAVGMNVDGKAILIHDSGFIPECRRHSPVMPVDRAMDGCWPATSEDGWCGEHEPQNPPKNDLAKYSHEVWSDWMRTMLNQAEDTQDDDDSIRMTWPVEVMDRWVRQARTPYEELPDSDREAAKAEARKILNIIRRGGQ